MGLKMNIELVLGSTKMKVKILANALAGRHRGQAQAWTSLLETNFILRFEKFRDSKEIQLFCFQKKRKKTQQVCLGPSSSSSTKSLLILGPLKSAGSPKKLSSALFAKIYFNVWVVIHFWQGLLSATIQHNGKHFFHFGANCAIVVFLAPLFRSETTMNYST